MLFVVFLLLTAIASCKGLTSDEMAAFKTNGHPEHNTGLVGTVSLALVQENQIRLTSNAIPDHKTGNFPDPATNPNEIREQNVNVRFPTDPQVSTTTYGCLPFGPIGYAVNGVPIFNPFDADDQDAVNGPGAEVFDMCDGHPDPIGSYHYHQGPVCLENRYGHSSILGVALDGFPIYGQVDDDGNTVTSADLDACHGRFENGEYRYRITEDFPYVLGCYKGGMVQSNARKCTCNAAVGDGSELCSE